MKMRFVAIFLAFPILSINSSFVLAQSKTGASKSDRTKEATPSKSKQVLDSLKEQEQKKDEVVDLSGDSKKTPAKPADQITNGKKPSAKPADQNTNGKKRVQKPKPIKVGDPPEKADQTKPATKPGVAPVESKTDKTKRAKQGPPDQKATSRPTSRPAAKTAQRSGTASINSKLEIRHGTRTLKDDEKLTAEVFGKTKAEQLKNMREVVIIYKIYFMKQANDGTMDDPKKVIEVHYKYDLDRANELKLNVAKLRKLRLPAILYEWDPAHRGKILKGHKYQFLSCSVDIDKSGEVFLHYLGSRAENAPYIQGRTVGMYRLPADEEPVGPAKPARKAPAKKGPAKTDSKPRPKQPAKAS